MFVTVNGFAQKKAKMTEEQKKEMMARFEAYKEKLNLTEEQQPEVQKINTEYFESLAGLRESNASRMNKLLTFRDLKSARDSKMKKVLTKEQYKIFTDFQAETREEFMQNRRN
jgi:hypothetical protein